MELWFAILFLTTLGVGMFAMYLNTKTTKNRLMLLVTYYVIWLSLLLMVTELIGLFFWFTSNF